MSGPTHDLRKPHAQELVVASGDITFLNPAEEVLLCTDRVPHLSRLQMTPFFFLLTSGLYFGHRPPSRTSEYWVSPGWDSLPIVCEKAFSSRGRHVQGERAQMAPNSALQLWLWRRLSGIWALLMVKWGTQIERSLVTWISFYWHVMIQYASPQTEHSGEHMSCTSYGYPSLTYDTLIWVCGISSINTLLKLPSQSAEHEDDGATTLSFLIILFSEQQAD